MIDRSKYGIPENAEIKEVVTLGDLSCIGCESYDDCQEEYRDLPKEILYKVPGRGTITCHHIDYFGGHPQCMRERILNEKARKHSKN